MSDETDPVSAEMERELEELTQWLEPFMDRAERAFTFYPELRERYQTIAEQFAEDIPKAIENIRHDLTAVSEPERIMFMMHLNSELRKTISYFSLVLAQRLVNRRTDQG